MLHVKRYPTSISLCGFRSSARAEDDGDRPGRPWLVLGPGQVLVEDPAHGVAGQVLKDGLDDELVNRGGPGPAGRQLPRLLPGADLRGAVDELAAWPAHLQAPGEQSVIKRAAEGDLQRLARSGRRDRQLPGDGIDMPALFAADLVPPLRRNPERKPVRVTEPVPDDQPERLARAQRVPGRLVAGQAALDASGIKQDGEPAAGRPPPRLPRPPP